jgi:hypothetical protein
VWMPSAAQIMPSSPRKAVSSTFAQTFPLERHWTGDDGDRPLRWRTIHARPSRKTLPPPEIFNGSLYHATDGQESPFNFTRHMRRLCEDIVTRCPEFYHIETSRLLFTVAQSRTSGRSGLHAKVTPLRFQDGEIIQRRRRRDYQIQRFFVNGVEMLYLVGFCLPRFQNLSFDEKFVTIFHELYHIGPAFEGDIRRHEGRCCVHTHSKKSYDEHMKALAREYLAKGVNPGLHAFLRLDFGQLEQRHGRIIGHIVPCPRLLPVE